MPSSFCFSLTGWRRPVFVVFPHKALQISLAVLVILAVTVAPAERIISHVLMLLFNVDRLYMLALIFDAVVMIECWLPITSRNLSIQIA